MNKGKLMMVANKVSGCVKRGCSIIVPILASVALDKGKDYILDKITISSIKNYDDAVKVILDSGMFSSSKKEAIKLLMIDGDAEYYRTIARIVLSSAYSSSKIDMIKDINTKKGES